MLIALAKTKSSSLRSFRAIVAGALSEAEEKEAITNMKLINRDHTK